MHQKIKSTQFLDTALAGFGIAFLLLFVLSTKVSAASGCNLAFSTQPTNAAVQAGGNLTRTVTVKNTGSTPCKQTSFSLYYSPNETFVSSTPAARAGNYYWVIGSLAPGKQSSVTVTTKHNPTIEGVSIDTEGCATASNGKDACTSSSVMVSGSTTSPIPSAPVPPVTQTPSSPSPTTTPPVIKPVPSSQSKELGMWVWDFPSQMITATAQSKMQQIAKHGFNVVYITIDDYLDIASMPEGSTKEKAKATYFANLSTFVQQANALGIQVDAEGGWKDWALEANKWKGFALIDAVKQYNAAYPHAKLRGFQYDVEPYLLDNYEREKAKVLTQFVAFIDQSANRLAGTDIKFSMAIPHFYDSAQAWTPAITYGGKTTHTFNHLLNILEKTPGSTILLMSYRDTFEGANGTRNIVEAELKDAVGYSTRVIVSQETGNVDPDFVTFYGSTKSDVFSNLGKINDAFKSYTSHGGNAVHYLDSFLEMRN